LSEHDQLAERTPSVRFARNLALSISGGALATLLGANAAHAQDAGTAAAASKGTGSVTTGDATATGNQANTNTTQTITVSGNLGVIQVINQQANVSNIGAAVANTGGNVAIGNTSDNTAASDQTADGGTTGGAANNGAATNVSDGTANVTTGKASAVGNQADTNIVQEAHGSAHGQLGGILVINQDANVINAGVALANTGANFAFANDSDNDAGLLQQATADGGSLANNNGSATNDSNGKATINTGPASATGNDSHTNITQKATGDAGGQLGGLMIINQDTHVINAGAGVANTGANFGFGNTSDNEAQIGDAAPQTAVAAGTLLDDIGIASNNGEASNGSGGSATITTGPATAVGNNSTTTVNQTATGKIDGPFGGGIVTQDSDVLNAGFALANSGFNFANGNDSDNLASVDQLADGAGFTDVGVIGNFGLAASDSDGTGAITSGPAQAAGNQSTTNVGQTADIHGGNFAVQTQGNDIANLGAGLANTGGNVGVGNTSSNQAFADQLADIDLPPAGAADVGVIGQFGKAANDSDGTATITTGAATAVGNNSKTNVTQKADPTASTVQVQQANVLNAGFGLANTGGNVAVGNESDNDAALALADVGATPVSADLIGGGGSGDPFLDLDALLPSLGPIAGALDTVFPGASDFAGALLEDGIDAFHDSIPDEVTDALHDPLHQVHHALHDLYGSLNDPLAALGNPADLPGVPSGLGHFIGRAADDPITALTDAATEARDRLRGAHEDGAAEPVDAEVGPASTDQANANQAAGFGVAGPAAIGTLTVSNDGEAANTSDGSATVTTGAANSGGNVSTTDIAQTTDAGGDGLGIAVSVQNAGVTNVGLGNANTGGNDAHGNRAEGDASLTQDAAGAVGPGGLQAGIVTVHNGGAATNDSDGDASITTGAATANGNNSTTNLTQDTDADIDGLGTVVAVQNAEVRNVGVGNASTGDNTAVGNEAVQSAALRQGVDLDVTGDAAVGTLTMASSGQAANTSDGTAKITTGVADAAGNRSNTTLGQTADSSVEGLGTIITPQTASVDNLGSGIANTGGNEATGNGVTNNEATTAQLAEVDVVGAADPATPALRAGVLTVAATGEAANTSDGTATITTGTAKGLGNTSATTVTQADPAEITDDGIGLILEDQDATVRNIGLGVANSGDNLALGNASRGTASSLTNDSALDVDGDAAIGTATVAHAATASNDSEGTAGITTGAADGQGNVSQTTVGQDADSTVGDDGLGTLIGIQDAVVVNNGTGLGNTGGNDAVGNGSGATAAAGTTGVVDVDGDLAAGVLTVAPAAHAENLSNGTAAITTGVASGTGNTSSTTVGQDLTGAELGLGLALQTQGAEVRNEGAGFGNSGVNGAVGNASISAADVDQSELLPVGGDLTAGVLTVAGTGTATDASNGKATIATGAASGKGNVSTTDLSQKAGADITDPDLGLIVGTQDATVANGGLGIGNSGINGAIGNGSGFLPGDVNSATLEQTINDGPMLPGGDVTAGVLTLANNGQASTESDGTATIATGKADGVGNNSTTKLGQDLVGHIDDTGLVVATQTGGVANGGTGIGNSGVNGAVGNLSANEADAEQAIGFASPNNINILGPGTVVNNGHAANESNGTATINTGAAAGVGNASNTTLGQHLDIDPGDGLAVIAMGGTVSNTGTGIGNSGVNGAIGNISDNTATSTQTATLDPGVNATLPVQTTTNNGGAENNSTGTGKVATGSAAGTGNSSTTGLTQAATVDGPGAIATIAGGTVNTGTGIANTGINLGVGNASQNVANQTQTATGAGLASNNGVAGNGATTPGIQVPGVPGGPGGPGGPGTPGTPGGPGTDTPGTPGGPGTDPPGTGHLPGVDPTGRPSLPATGSEAAAEALIGAMLLLAGFGFRRAGKRLA
jgi:hypothetical protein